MYTPIKTPSTDFINRRKTLEINHKFNNLIYSESFIKANILTVRRWNIGIDEFGITLTMNSGVQFDLSYRDFKHREEAYTALCEIFDGETF